MKLLQGVFRKISLPVLGVATVGWVVFVVGFGVFNNGDNFYNDIRKNATFTTGEGTKFPLPFPDEHIEEDFPAQRADPDYFAHWCYVVSFPVLMIFLVLHLILHNLYIFGLIGHSLLGLCLICNSGVFWRDGLILFSADDNLRKQEPFTTFPKDWRRDTYYGLWLVVEWVGAFVCMLALAVYVVLLPFYTSSCKNSNSSNSEEGNKE